MTKAKVIYSQDEALKEEAALEVKNSERVFKDYTPDDALIEKSTLEQIEWLLEAD